MMQVPIPVEMEPFVKGIVADGSYHDTAEVVGDALRLLAHRRRLLDDVKAGVAELDRGEYTEYGENSRQAFMTDIETEELARFPHADNRQ